MAIPRHRESDSVLLTRLGESTQDTVAQLEANARYYMEIAAKLRLLRTAFSPKVKPPTIALREIVDVLNEAGMTHTGHLDEGEISSVIDPGITAARTLLDEIIFHNGESYYRDDEIAMRRLRVATGQEAPTPEPSDADKRANLATLEAFFNRLCPALENLRGIFAEAHATGAL